MAAQNDLRYQKTEDAIRNAFLDQLAHAPLASLSVTQVCTQARVSRNAFYAHYPNLSALYARMMEELAETARDACREGGVFLKTGKGGFPELAAYALRKITPHERTLRTFLSCDGGTLTKQLAMVASDELYQSVKSYLQREPSEHIRLMISYMGYGVVGFLSYWLTETESNLEDVLDAFMAMHSKANETLNMVIETAKAS